MTETPQGILLTVSKTRSFKKKKMNTFLVNQNNNAQRKTLTADEDELLFVTGKDICYFSFDTFLLRPGKRKTIIIDNFTPALLQTDERPWKICCCKINSYTFDIPFASKIQNCVFHYCLQWIFNLFYLTAWTKVPHGIDKARFTITAVINWSLKSTTTANNYYITLAFTWKADKYISISRLGCKPLEVQVKSDTITQMMTDAFIRGWQTTHGVSGCLHEKTRTGASLIPGRLFDFVLCLHDWVISYLVIWRYTSCW